MYISDDQCRRKILITGLKKFEPLSKNNSDYLTDIVHCQNLMILGQNLISFIQSFIPFSQNFMTFTENLSQTDWNWFT